MIYVCNVKKAKIYINTAKKSAQQVKTELGCDAVINGGLYDMSKFVPYCHLKADGKVLAKDQYTYYGYAFNAEGGLTLTTDYSGYSNYICCVCLLRNGKAEKMYYDSAVGRSAERTAIGTYPDGRVWLYAASASLTPEEMQAIALKEGLKDAVMLDGGGSTQCAFPSGNITSTRKVHNYICVWAEPEKEPEKQAEPEAAKVKVYLSPSSQPANAYASGGTNEQAQCRRIAEYAKAAFERCGFDCKIGAAEIDYTGRTAESNKWGADIHIPIHTNAGGGHGVRVFVYSKTKERLALAQPVYDAINGIALYKSTSGVTEYPGLYEVKNTSGKCVYVEAAFHDNAVEAKWIIDSVEEIGGAICKGICAGTGVKYVQQQEQEEKETTLEERVAALEAWAKTKGYIG